MPFYTTKIEANYITTINYIATHTVQTPFCL